MTPGVRVVAGEAVAVAAGAAVAVADVAVAGAVPDSTGSPHAVPGGLAKWCGFGVAARFDGSALHCAEGEAGARHCLRATEPVRTSGPADGWHCGWIRFRVTRSA